MPKNSCDLDRRRVIELVALGAAAPIAGSLFLGRDAMAADLPHVDESDPAAVGLGYKHEASEVDQEKHAQYKSGQTCSNCRYFQSDADSGWAPCVIFPGKTVHANGWCSAYAQKG